MKTYKCCWCDSEFEAENEPDRFYGLDDGDGDGPPYLCHNCFERADNKSGDCSIVCGLIGECDGSC